MARTRSEAREPWTHGEVVANDVRLHYVEAGDPANPLVVLLHGFPEFWYAWRHQIPALADAGYHVVAPDLRGYNDSEKPHGVDAYRLTHLVADVVALIDEFATDGPAIDESAGGRSGADGSKTSESGTDGSETDESGANGAANDRAGSREAIVVGHDWGGAIAWEVAIRRPERVRKLAVLNAPHPERFQRELGSASQLRKSWYMFFFQTPRAPETSIRAGDFRVLSRMLRDDPVDPNAFDAVDVERYKDALAKPGALTAAINYYRALGRENGVATLRRAVSGGPDRAPASRRIRVPTLLLWGEQDSALDVSLTEGLDPWVDDLRVERLPDASHWVQADAPREVNDALIDFCGS